jgi:exosortase
MAEVLTPPVDPASGILSPGMAQAIPPVRGRRPLVDVRPKDATEAAAWLLTAVAFVLLFARPAISLASDWWNDPDAGHGMLLAPVAIWLAWKTGRHPESRPNLAWGLAIIAVSVVVRYVSGLAAELFTMRASMMLALVGLTVCYAGLRQVIRWWLPFVIAGLSIPLPELVTSAISLPLQFKASELGATLLQTRDIPVRLDGNVIRLPGHQLFVAEACSGLRSLTALIALGVLLGGLMLRTPIGRIALLALAVPVAIAINGVRVFLTGFLVYFVDPKLAEGFMHVTEGWLLFLVSLAGLGIIAWMCRFAERLVPRWRDAGAAA